ncbi:hypothetical protein TWF481_010775 [Arthrobotrys musiformis]|uniref:Uncharacterized protein n=1 Tax=Arthrobotrys musiformis TaxID=47236 RepID=A0AAV9W3M0_9PEZI
MDVPPDLLGAGGTSPLSPARVRMKYTIDNVKAKIQEEEQTHCISMVNPTFHTAATHIMGREGIGNRDGNAVSCGSDLERFSLTEDTIPTDMELDITPLRSGSPSGQVPSPLEKRTIFSLPALPEKVATDQHCYSFPSYLKAFISNFLTLNPNCGTDEFDWTLRGWCVFNAQATTTDNQSSLHANISKFFDTIHNLTTPPTSSSAQGNSRVPYKSCSQRLIWNTVCTIISRKSVDNTCKLFP